MKTDKKIEKITRVEIIDWTKGALKGGRVFVHWDENTEVTYEIQDNGRTLKVFIERKQNETR